MKNVYIEKIQGKEFIEKSTYQESIELVEFQRDLLKQFNLTIVEKNLQKGLQNNYIDMVTNILDEFLIEELRCFDVILLAQNTPNIDPSLSLVCYITEKYGIVNPCFAITDYGSNIGIGAIRIGKELMVNNNFNKMLILLIEQNTLPLNNGEKSNFNDIGIAVVLSSNSEDKNVYIRNHHHFYMETKPSTNEILSELGLLNFGLNVISNIDNKYSTRSLQTLQTAYLKIQSNDIDYPLLLIEYDDQNKKIDLLEIFSS